MTTQQMLLMWMRQEGWRPTEGGFERLTENGYLVLPDRVISHALTHFAPELFSTFIRACQVEVREDLIAKHSERFLRTMLVHEEPQPAASA